MTAPAPDISIVICTHNPDLSLLGEVLQAIHEQRGGSSMETVLVDNLSSQETAVGIRTLLEGTPASYVQEPQLGLSVARRTGIRSASAPLICFVDDDNILSRNYVETALHIASEEPTLGVFGGCSLARTSALPGWLCDHFLARYAVRAEREPVTLRGPERAMRGLEPFGAGMVVQRNVAEAFSSLVRTFDTGMPLGRIGDQLGSGEDSLFARVAFRMGLQAGYRPELCLEHVIPDNRLRWSYLKRLIEGQGQSESVLDHLDDQWPGILKPGEPDSALAASVRFLRRLASTGLAEAIGMIAWDRGYRASHSRAQAIAAHLAVELARIGRSGT